MANELDELMNLDPLSLNDQDIDAIVAYHRKNRGLSEAGVKPKKEEGPKISILDKLPGLTTPPKGPMGIKRRI